MTLRQTLPGFLKHLTAATLLTLLSTIVPSQDLLAQNAGSPAVEAASDPGQADLDEAIVKRIDAESEQELESVAALLESSLKKGLDKENQTFAEKMLGSVLLQRAQGLAAAMVQARGRRQLAIREEVLETLHDAVEHDPELVEAYLLIARLNLMQGGSKAEITKATSKAIELLDDNPAEQSSALVLRALTQDDDKDKLADLDLAVKADPENIEAVQARAALKLQLNDVEGAMSDLEKVLLKDPTNQAVAGAAVQKLVELNRVDEAKNLITKILATKPSEGMYRMRAILYRADNKLDEAMSDLNKAMAMSPNDPMTLMQRATLSLDRDDIKAAKDDFRNALRLAPQIANADEAIELRLQIALKEKRLADAINDAKLLVDRVPENVFRRMRLSSLYSMDKRPRKAIEVLTDILDEDPKNVAVLRSRGDAQLSVGAHDKAILDYEKAIEALGNIDIAEADEREKTEASGIYNNLSWVLATSPNDEVRNGKRAVELAEKSAEMTDYSEAHILSTLAASHAENGDFDKAIEWSQKAVDLATQEEHDQLEQLQEELDKYKAGEPWREKQETDENQIPILNPEDLIDT